MTEERTNVRRIFGSVDETRHEGFDWRKVPRSEMFERVITAVDCAYGEAQAGGDLSYMGYCDEVLYPFLESEIERAQAEES